MAAGVLGLFAGLALFLVFVWIFFVALAVFVFIFWLMMLIDCLKRDFKNDNDKIIWVLVLIFLQFIGALIYCFMVKKSSGKKK